MNLTDLAANLNAAITLGIVCLVAFLAAVGAIVALAYLGAHRR